MRSSGRDVEYGNYTPRENSVVRRPGRKMDEELELKSLEAKASRMLRGGAYYAAIAVDQEEHRYCSMAGCIRAGDVLADEMSEEDEDAVPTSPSLSSSETSPYK